MGNAIYWRTHTHTCEWSGPGSIKTVLNGHCVLSSHIVRRLNNKYKAKSKTPLTNTRQCSVRTTNDTRTRQRWGESEQPFRQDWRFVLPQHTNKSMELVLFEFVFYFRMNFLWTVNCRDWKNMFPFLLWIIHRPYDEIHFSHRLKPRGQVYRKIEFNGRPLKFILKKWTKHIYYPTAIWYLFSCPQHTYAQCTVHTHTPTHSLNNNKLLFFQSSRSLCASFVCRFGLKN